MELRSSERTVWLSADWVTPQVSGPAHVNLRPDDDLVAKAIKMTGGLDRSTVLREGLKALIERESALRLAKLGGTQPQLELVPRRRAATAP